MVEQRTVNARVAGSSPACGANFLTKASGSTPLLSVATGFVSLKRPHFSPETTPKTLSGGFVFQNEPTDFPLAFPVQRMYS